MTSRRSLFSRLVRRDAHGESSRLPLKPNDARELTPSDIRRTVSPEVHADDADAAGSGIGPLVLLWVVCGLLAGLVLAAGALLGIALLP